MALIDALLLDAVHFGVWLAERTDGIVGSGTAADPFNCGTRVARAVPVTFLNYGDGVTEVEVGINDGSQPFADGDMVAISGLTGDSAPQWNTTFGVYGVGIEPAKFKIAFAKSPDPPAGFPVAAKVLYPFDNLMVAMPAYTKIHLGPGVYETRGFAPGGGGGWQPKSGQKIVGAGIDVTTLRLVGATTPDENYHAIGMRITPAEGMPLTPLESFEVSDLTIDANVDGQPIRGTVGYPQVACGAVRIMGNHCCVRGIKAIGWGTRSAAQGCFVISLIAGSAEGSDTNGNPTEIATADSGIRDCILIRPGQNNIRETTVLHVGGRKHATAQAQAFGIGPYVRRNFVDCSFVPASGTPFSSFFITAQSTSFEPAGDGQVLVTFVGKRPHFRQDGQYVRISNPRFPANRWNGYFPITTDQPTPPTPPDPRKFTFLMPDPGSDDHTLIVAGTDFRGIAMSSCLGGAVEQNQIHNCWTAGPYQSFLDDSPTAQAPEPENALNTLSLIVRNNNYKNVTVGPYWNMGGLSGPVPPEGDTENLTSMAYNRDTGVVTASTAWAHNLWVGARVRIEAADDPRYEGMYEITDVYSYPISYASYFKYQLPARLENLNPGHARYRVVSGTDSLLVEGNVIEVADLDETEFAIKEYPLASSPALQQYRACGIIVGHNGLSPQGGPYAHGQVIVRHNKIYYLDDQTFSNVPEVLGPPAGYGMQISGAQHVQVSYNVLRLNPRNPLRLFRCGPAQFFNNKQPNGVLVPGWQWDTNGHYDEPETLAEDAMILSLLLKR